MTTATTVKIDKAAAVALFGALGVDTASKWAPARMATKLLKIGGLVDDETAITDAGVNETLTQVLEAVENGATITVVGGAKAAKNAIGNADAKTATKKKARAKADKAEAKVLTKVAQLDEAMVLAVPYNDAAAKAEANLNALAGLRADADKAEADLAEAGAKIVAKAVKKAAKDKADAARELRANTVTKSRSYYSGVVLKKHQSTVLPMPKRATKELIQEVDDLYSADTGKTNLRESGYALRWAIQACAGYDNSPNK